MIEPTATQRTFLERVRENKGGAVIFAGSGSDESHIEKIVKSLEIYQIPYEVRVASAHKQSEVVQYLISQYDGYDCGLVYIAVARGTDALSGMLSWQSHRPVISCPPDHPNASSINNPPGSSNMYIGHPSNVGRAVAQVLSIADQRYIGLIRGSNIEKKQSLKDDDHKLKKKFEEQQWDLKT